MTLFGFEKTRPEFDMNLVVFVNSFRSEFEMTSLGFESSLCPKFVNDFSRI